MQHFLWSLCVIFFCKKNPTVFHESTRIPSLPICPVRWSVYRLGSLPPDTFANPNIAFFRGSNLRPPVVAVAAAATTLQSLCVMRQKSTLGRRQPLAPASSPAPVTRALHPVLACRRQGRSWLFKGPVRNPIWRPHPHTHIYNYTNIIEYLTYKNYYALFWSL
jgi:hypothetical protein